MKHDWSISKIPPEVNKDGLKTQMARDDFSEQMNKEVTLPKHSTKVLSRDFVKRHGMFFLFVFIPTALAMLYYGLFASDVYISESKFVVKSPDRPAMPGIGALLSGAGFSNANEELHGAETFATSRDALHAVNKGDQFRRAYSSSSISIFDRFDPLGVSASFEALYKYFQGKVGVAVDTSTSISTLTVKAYTPEDARRLNEELLELSEAKVNQLNTRGREDLVRFAQVDVDQAQQKDRQAAMALAAFRGREQLVDPEKQAAVEMQMISKLQDELISTQTQLLQVQQFAAENPQIPVLRTKISKLKREIGAETSHMAGGSGSLAASAPEYQQLQVASQTADKQLAAAIASLEDARNEARRKQVYVERLVQPNLPDAPLEPRRLRSILATFLLGMIAWGVCTMLFAGVKEHSE
jgi:capsular polysaccharide transport system permease protein